MKAKSVPSRNEAVEARDKPNPESPALLATPGLGDSASPPAAQSESVEANTEDSGEPGAVRTKGTEVPQMAHELIVKARQKILALLPYATISAERSVNALLVQLVQDVLSSPAPESDAGPGVSSEDQNLERPGDVS